MRDGCAAGCARPADQASGVVGRPWAAGHERCGSPLSLCLYWCLCVRVLLFEPFLRGETLDAWQRVSSRPHRHCGSSLSCSHWRDSSTAVSEHSQIIMIWTCDVIMIWDSELIAAVLWHPAEHSNFGVADSQTCLFVAGFHTSCPVGLGQLNNQEAVAQGCPAWFRAATGPTVPYKASLGARVAAEATRMGSYVHH